MNARTYNLLKDIGATAAAGKEATANILQIISEYTIKDDLYESSALTAAIDYLESINALYAYFEIDKDDMTGGTAIVVISCGDYLQTFEWNYERRV